MTSKTEVVPSDEEVERLQGIIVALKDEIG